MLETANILDFQESWGPHYDAYPDPVLIARGDADGKIVLFNRQAELLFGYSRAEITGHPIEDLLPERFRDQHCAHRLRYIDDPSPRTMGRDLKLFLLRKTGTEIECLISLGPLLVSEGFFVVVTIRRK